MQALEIDTYLKIPHYSNYFTELEIRVNSVKEDTLEKTGNTLGLSTTRVAQIRYAIQQKISRIKAIERVKRLTLEEKYDSILCLLDARKLTALNKRKIYTYRQLLTYKKEQDDKYIKKIWDYLKVELEYVGFTDENF